MHVGKGHAGARKRSVREVVHNVPSVDIAGMPGELPAPQKRDRVGHLCARRSAVHIGREGLPEEPERCRRIADLEVAERKMPVQMAI